jgi:hypothetical protein
MLGNAAQDNQWLSFPNAVVLQYLLLFFSFSLLQAFVVLGQFLVLKKNKELFQDWMKDVCGANTKQSSDCYQCLSDWCDEFL